MFISFRDIFDSELQTSDIVISVQVYSLRGIWKVSYIVLHSIRVLHVDKYVVPSTVMLWNDSELDMPVTTAGKYNETHKNYENKTLPSRLTISS